MFSLFYLHFIYALAARGFRFNDGNFSQAIQLLRDGFPWPLPPNVVTHLSNLTMDLNNANLFSKAKLEEFSFKNGLKVLEGSTQFNYIDHMDKLSSLCLKRNVAVEKARWLGKVFRNYVDALAASNILPSLEPDSFLELLDQYESSLKDSLTGSTLSNSKAYKDNIGSSLRTLSKFQERDNLEKLKDALDSVKERRKAVMKLKEQIEGRISKLQEIYSEKENLIKDLERRKTVITGCKKYCDGENFLLYSQNTLESRLDEVAEEKRRMLAGTPNYTEVLEEQNASTAHREALKSVKLLEDEIVDNLEKINSINAEIKETQSISSILNLETTEKNSFSKYDFALSLFTVGFAFFEYFSFFLNR